MIFSKINVRAGYASRYILSGAKLQGVDFTKIFLRRVNLQSAQLAEAPFSKVLGDVNSVAYSTVVGHIAFSPVTVDDSNQSFIGYILAPLAVQPEYQKRQIGSRLIENGLARLSRINANVVFVYGDPQYYSKFGFNPEVASRYSPPYELQYPFGWQAMSLSDDIPRDSAVKISCVASLNDPALW